MGVQVQYLKTPAQKRFKVYEDGVCWKKDGGDLVVVGANELEIARWAPGQWVSAEVKEPGSAPEPEVEPRRRGRIV